MSARPSAVPPRPARADDPPARFVEPPIPAHVLDNRWRILGVLCLSLVLIVAANSALNVALPTLVRDLGATATELQWIVDAYALVFAGLLLPMGAIGDRFGRKGILQAGLAVFAVASGLSAVSTTPVQLIATRGLMGVGAAMVMPATLSLLAASFPARERGRAIAVWAGFAGAGGALGPVLSGLLLERFWWGSVFLINLPLILIAVLAGARLLPRSRESVERPLDPVGAVLSMIALGALLLGIIEGPERGWTDPVTVAGFLVAVVIGGAFVAWERRSDHPMLDLSWFRDRRFSVGSATITLAFFAAFGVFFLATQYFQFVLGYSPLLAAFAGLPIAAALIVVAPRSAGLVERFGHRRVVSSGLVLVSLGLAWLATVATPDTAYPLVAVGLVVFGCGIAMTTAPSTGLIISALPVDRAGVGSAVNDTTREFGGSLGVAVLGSIMASAYRSGLDVSVLPDAVRDVAHESIGAALALAADLPDAAQGAAFARAAGVAFTDAFSAAMYVAAAVALLAAGMVAALGIGPQPVIGGHGHAGPVEDPVEGPAPGAAPEPAAAT